MNNITALEIAYNFAHVLVLLTGKATRETTTVAMCSDISLVTGLVSMRAR